MSILLQDDLWAEINDAPGEIFDIPDLDEEFPSDDESFSAFLNSTWDF